MRVNNEVASRRREHTELTITGGDTDTTGAMKPSGPVAGYPTDP